MDDERNQPPTRPDAPPGYDTPAQPGATHEDDQPAYEPNRTGGPLFAGPGQDPEDGPSMFTRAGWVAMGIFLGVFSPLVAYLLYYRRDPLTFWVCMRYVLVGVGLGILVEIMLFQAVVSGSGTSPSAAPGSPGWTSSNF